jgi:hypothetical protein
MSNIKSITCKLDESLIKQSEALLERCKKGEVQEFMCIELRRDGCLVVNSTSVRDRHQFAGALLELAITRLMAG